MAKTNLPFHFFLKTIYLCNSITFRRFAASPLHRFTASLMILFFMQPICVQAQSSLFEEVGAGTVLTSDEQQKMSEFFQIEPQILSYRVVSINPIESFLVGNGVQANIPGVSNSELFTTDYISSPSSGNYTWAGYTAAGSMMILNKNASGFSGSAVYAQTNQSFKIRSISSTRSVLFSIPSAIPGNEECATEPDANDDTDTVVIDRSCDFNVIRVLFLFTALSGSPSAIAADANTVISELNTCAAGSGLLPVSISFQLAGVLPMPAGFVESNGKAKPDLIAAKIFPGVAALRDGAFADIVVIVTTTGHSDAVGVANAIAAKSSKAFCLVEAPFLTGPFFTGVHEISHVMGGIHQTCPSCFQSGCDQFTFHHGFAVGPASRTVMYQNGCPTPRTRILRWSSPEAPFMGSATGNTFNNNREIINNRAEVIACFLGTPPPAPPIGNFVGINGPSQICANGSNYIYYATFNPAVLTPPITFSWEMSPNGWTGWVPWGTSSSINLSGSSFNGNYATLRLTINDANGVVGISTMGISKNPFCFSGSGDDRFEEEKLSKQSDLVIFPNPTEGFFTISNVPAFSAISVFDLQGRQIDRTIFEKTGKSTSIDFDASEFAKGVYFIKIQSEKSTITRKIIQQ